MLLIIALAFPSTAYAAVPDIPDFSGAAAIELYGNIPAFLPGDIAAGDYIKYSELDVLGRVGPATACISRNSFSTELRAESGDFLPVGWQTVRYDDVIDGRYLFSLCHVISPELSGAGSDPRNIFTGTRYLRAEGMQPFEDMIEDFLNRTADHVLYRVTPFYRGDALVPFGVQMEAYSVEDAGRSVCFNVFVYNVQPDVGIDYRSGESYLNTTLKVASTAEDLISSHFFSLEEGTSRPSVGSFAALLQNQTHTTSAGTSAKGAASASAKASQTGYGADQNDDEDDKATRAVSSFLDYAGFSGDELIGNLRYDDAAYEQAVYGSESN